MKRLFLSRIFLGSGLLLMSMMVVMHMKDSAVAVAASDGTTPGEFTSYGFNNPTLITDLVLSSSANDAMKEEMLVPQSTYYLNATLQDMDGFTHQDIYFVVFHSEEEVITTELVDAAIDQGVTSNSFVVRYFTPERSTFLSTAPNIVENIVITTAVDNFMIKSGTTPVDTSGLSDDVDYVSPLVFSTENDSTWSFVSGESVLSETQTEPGVAERTISIAFSPSKVAPQAIGQWHVAVVVYDRYQIEKEAPNTQTLYTYEASDSAYSMAFYGEIQLEVGQIVQFDHVTPGDLEWKDSSNSVYVRYIANGEFNRTATADVRWQSSVVGSTDAQLHDLLSADDMEHQFYLQVYRDAGTNYDDLEIQTDGLFGSASSTLAILPAVDTDYSTTGVQSSTTDIETNVQGTIERGQLTPFIFQIKLSPAFQNATYSGNVTVGIIAG